MESAGLKTKSIKNESARHKNKIPFASHPPEAGCLGNLFPQKIKIRNDTNGRNKIISANVVILYIPPYQRGIKGVVFHTCNLFNSCNSCLKFFSLLRSLPRLGGAPLWFIYSLSVSISSALTVLKLLYIFSTIASAVTASAAASMITNIAMT
jgi:hypothetical protein